MTMHPAARPIGWEWAERYPDVYRDDALPLARTPCPVCGHPTGDCTQEDHAIMSGERATPDTATVQGGHTTAADAIESAITDPAQAQVVVKEDVFEDVSDPGATTQRQRLKYHRGQVITEDEARANKVTAVQQQNIRGGETK